MNSTGFSPCEIKLIQLKEKPIRFWKNWIGKNNDELRYNQKLELALKNIKRHGKRRADTYNSTHKTSRFKVGDLVLVKALHVKYRSVQDKEVQVKPGSGRREKEDRIIIPSGRRFQGRPKFAKERGVQTPSEAGWEKLKPKRCRDVNNNEKKLKRKEQR